MRQKIDTPKRFRQLAASAIGVVLVLAVTPAPLPTISGIAAADHQVFYVGGVACDETGTQSVTIDDDFFSPANISIQAGTTVKWTNWGDNTHTTTDEHEEHLHILDQHPDAEWHSGDLAGGNPGEHYWVRFCQSGVSYPYLCIIHEFTGTVTVTTP